MKRTLLAAVALVGLLSTARGQAPPCLSCPPARGPSPLLFVRFAGAPGGRVTFYRGDRGGPREFEFPVTVGLRPGYVYRVKIDGLPGQKRPLYPTLEVRGSLYLLPHVNPAEYPVPFVLTEADVTRVFESVFISKVIYLEHPDRAVPVATRPGQLLERPLSPADDLVEEARQYGRPMVVVRVGERPSDTAELMACAIPGTILFPTEKSLPAASVRPYVPFVCVAPYDPVLGPKPPEEECLPDGGDCGHPAGIGPDGRLAGLDPTDTIAEYTDSKGRRHIMPSNRVCLCVPRFAALRSELPLAGYETRVVIANAEEAARQVQVGARLPSLAAHKYDQLTAMQVKQRASIAKSETRLDRLVRIEVLDAVHVYEGPALALGAAAVAQLTEIQRVRLVKQIELVKVLNSRSGLSAVQQATATSVIGRVEGLGVYTANVETAEVACVCGEVPQVMIDKPIHLCKWADREAAQVGDVVTFYLKYTNSGSKPIEDVAVSDSLSGRLEYVAGSAKTDRNAVFTTQQNEAGSAILRWEISGKLLPGQSGLISFQVRVR
jgi:uncharacterized repeat protein (TIGR01451 family)